MSWATVWNLSQLCFHYSCLYIRRGDSTQQSKIIYINGAKQYLTIKTEERHVYYGIKNFFQGLRGLVGLRAIAVQYPVVSHRCGRSDFLSAHKWEGLPGICGWAWVSLDTAWFPSTILLAAVIY